MQFKIHLLLLCALAVGALAATTVVDVGTSASRTLTDVSNTVYRVRVRGGAEAAVRVQLTGTRNVKINYLCRYLPQRTMFGLSANPGTTVDSVSNLSFNATADSFDWNDCFFNATYTSGTPGSSLSTINFTSTVYQDTLRRMIVDAGAYAFDGVTFNAGTGSQTWAWFAATTKRPYSWASALDGTPFPTNYISRDGSSTSSGLLNGKSYRVGSILPATDFSGTVAVSLTTSYQVWPAAGGSATLSLKAFQPVFAYFKVQIPTAASNQIQNHVLNVKFNSATAGDRVQVYTSSMATFSPLNSYRTDVTPGATGARAAIPTCAVDYANNVVYVVVMYAPTGTNSSTVEAGTLSVSATVDYSSVPSNPTAASSGTAINAGSTYLLSNIVAGDVFTVTGTSIGFRWATPQLLTTDTTNCTATPLNSGVLYSSGSIDSCALESSFPNIALQLVAGSGTGTLNRAAPVSVPTNGNSVVATVPNGGSVTVASASSQYPVALTLVPNNPATSFQEFNSVNNILYGSRCASTHTTAFRQNSEPETLMVLGCPGESLKIDGFARGFTAKQVGSAGTTVTRNVVVTTNGDVHTFDLAPNTPLAVRFNYPLTVGLQVTINGNITFSERVAIRMVNGGDFCTPPRPQSLSAQPVTQFPAMLIGTGSQTMFMATAAASRITVTFTAFSNPDPVTPAAPNPDCVAADSTTVPSQCTSLIPANHQVLKTDYSKDAAQALVADEIEHFSTLEGLGASGACYNAFVKESCLLRVPRCNATTGARVPTDACFELCMSRLQAAGCANTEAATPLHYCSVLPFCPVDVAIPIASYTAPFVDRNAVAPVAAPVAAPRASPVAPPTATGSNPVAAGSTPTTTGANPPTASGSGAPVSSTAPRAAPSASSGTPTTQSSTPQAATAPVAAGAPRTTNVSAASTAAVSAVLLLAGAVVAALL